MSRYWKAAPGQDDGPVPPMPPPFQRPPAPDVDAMIARHVGHTGSVAFDDWPPKARDLWTAWEQRTRDAFRVHEAERRAWYEHWGHTLDMAAAIAMEDELFNPYNDD